MTWPPEPVPRASRVAGASLALLVLAGAVVPSIRTYAAWSDFAVSPGHTGAGAWLTDGDPPLPPECEGMEFDRIIIGSNKDDVIVGTNGNDLVFGLQGQDVIDGLAGDDCLVGNQGKDPVLVGGPGNDVLVGGNGKDTLYGSEGDDRLYGSKAKDELHGGDGDDELHGGGGADTLVEDGLNRPPAPAPLMTEPEAVAPLTALTEPAPLPEADGASVEDPPEAPSTDPAGTEPGPAGAESGADTGEQQ